MTDEPMAWMNAHDPEPADMTQAAIEMRVPGVGEPHLGDPLAYVIANAIGDCDIDIIVGAFMPCGERWTLATRIANAVREATACPADAARRAALEEAAKALVDRLDFIHRDSKYQSVWTISQIHAGPYSGPTYTDELANLRSALAAGGAA